MSFILLRALAPFSPTRRKIKKIGYKSLKFIGISLTILYKFFDFATIVHSFGRAVVHQQTKPFEFYIIFSLSHFTSLLTLCQIRQNKSQIWRSEAKYSFKDFSLILFGCQENVKITENSSTLAISWSKPWEMSRESMSGSL